MSIEWWVMQATEWLMQPVTEGSHRGAGTPRLVYAVVGVGMVFSALAARQFRARMQAHRRKDQQALNQGVVLHASATIQAPDGGSNVLRADISQSSDGRYQLRLEDSRQAAGPSVQSFDRFDEVVSYLEHHTALRIGDFR
jgi:hypothetical protein